LNLNEKNEEGQYPLLLICNNNNTRMLKSLLKYAIQNNIALNLNEKDEEGQFPLLFIYKNNNIDMIKFLIFYANEYEILLKLDEEDNDGYQPLVMAIKNINMRKVLIKYAMEKNIYFEIENLLEECEEREEEYSMNNENIQFRKRKLDEITKDEEISKFYFENILTRRKTI